MSHKSSGLRRRDEKKTDYGKRLKLVKSGQPRLVVRRYLRNIKVQFIEYRREGDSILAEVCSSDIMKLGWKGHGSNLPSAYLCGYLCGKRAAARGVSAAVPDFGIQYSFSKGILFAAVKGVADSGISVKIGESAVPDERRIRGEHIAEYAAKIKQSPSYQRQFSSLLKAGLDPEKYPEHFDHMKKAVDETSPSEMSQAKRQGKPSSSETSPRRKVVKGNVASETSEQKVAESDSQLGDSRDTANGEIDD